MDEQIPASPAWGAPTAPRTLIRAAPALSRGHGDHSMGGQQGWEGTLESHYIPKATNGPEVG